MDDELANQIVCNMLDKILRRIEMGMTVSGSTICPQCGTVVDLELDGVVSCKCGMQFVLYADGQLPEIEAPRNNRGG